MTRVALYEGGNRRAGFFKLPLVGRLILSTPSTVRISKKVVDQVGGMNSIGEVSDEGVRNLDGNLLKQ